MSAALRLSLSASSAWLGSRPGASRSRAPAPGRSRCANRLTLRASALFEFGVIVSSCRLGPVGFHHSGTEDTEDSLARAAHRCLSLCPLCLCGGSLSCLIGAGAGDADDL